MENPLLSEQFFLIESHAFWVLAICFVVLERFFPVINVNRTKNFRLDCIGMIFLLFFVGIARQTIFNTYVFFKLSAVPSVAWGEFSISSLWQISAAFIVSDFFMYWIHRGMHRWQILWRTHYWHHSIEELYWFSGLRSSFLHVFLFACSQIFVAFFLFQLTPLEAGIAFGIGVFCQFFTHANWNFNFGPLKYFIVTPAFHRIHHHEKISMRDRNFGVTLSIWDFLFSTYINPADYSAKGKLGVPSASLPGMIPVILRPHRSNDGLHANSPTWIAKCWALS